MNIDEFIKKDNTFSESEFLAKVDNTFIMLLTSIMTDNMERVKHKISDALFKKYSAYINELNLRNERQIYDELNVKSTKIMSINENNDNYVIEVLLISRYMDYTINKDSNELVSGNNSSRVEKNNYLTFIKSKGAKKESIAHRCPSCGANIDTNNTGICSYCGSAYDTYSYDWVLTNISGL